MQGGRWVSVLKRFFASGPGPVHNVSSLSPVDSMSRVHSKLKATGSEKNQLSSRIGPTTAVLETVSGPQKPVEEEAPQPATIDPNASMWSSRTPVKAARKISAQRSRIADYYQTRMREDSVLLAEEDEPFVIGKIPEAKRRADETAVRMTRRARGRIVSADGDGVVALEQSPEKKAAAAYRAYNPSIVPRRGMHTTRTTKQSDDPCLPKPLPPQDCTFPNPLTKCVQEKGYPWPPICKISLCACMPPHPRLCKPNCDREAKAALSMGMKPEYDCPSYSECLKGVVLKKKTLPECCIHEFKYCATDQMGKARRKPFVWSVERMEKSLGQKYWTKGLCVAEGFHTDARTRCFHTAARLEDKKNTEECQKTGNMPCHKVE